ncbi:MAG TPA: ParB/RepB/Spo0J family partition protein [Vicinamibacterales bacterium]|nr:ParB/RepB/Spo0J family partition protein [Vicinamibacterales bacterium]
MSKKLAAKASLIQMPPPHTEPVEGSAERADAGEARAKTAPGSLAIFMASQSASVKEAEDLRERLKTFEGALPVRALDPQVVRPSRWANRHEHSFSDAAFAELKADIASAGTNVQPVSVRVVSGALNRSTPSAPTEYELVFGHRRHRACLELGLPVQAMVVDMSDQQLFEAMERENRARKNLSAWEQGTMYRRALDEGLYPSQRRLAESLGVDVSLVSKSLSLARLPEAVVGAFASPLEIQFRWAQPLAEALQKDPDGVLARAAKLRAAGVVIPGAQVLETLIGGAEPGALNCSTPAERLIQGTAGRKAVLVRDRVGRVVIKFPSGVLTEAAENEVATFLEKLISRR